MKQNFQLSPKEWQLLSAYLDGVVSPRERIQIEKKLDSEDSFRQALQSLRQTRTVIRSMPRRRVPRNFTLTPEMVQVRQPARFFPVLRFSSAFAAIAAVILFAIQLLPTSMKAAAPTAAPAALEMSAAAAPAGTEPPLIFWGEPAAQAEKGMGGGGGGGDGYAFGMGGGAADSSVYAPTPSIQFVIPQTTSEPGVGGESEPLVEAPAPTATENTAPPLAAAPLEATPSVEEGTAEPLQEATATPEPSRNQSTLTGNPVLGLNLQESGKIITESQPLETAQSLETEKSQISLRSLLLPAAIGLSVLALLTAIAAFILWKKSHL